jgi:hypothetical protein
MPDPANVAPEEKPEHEASDATEVFDASQLAPLFQNPAATPEALAQGAAQLGITADELARLRAGQSSLAVTPTQKEQLLAVLARAYQSPTPAPGQGGAQPAAAPDHEATQDNESDAWSCSGSPAPTTAPPTPVARRIPAETGTKNDIKENGPGTTAVDTAVGGGRVTMRYGVPSEWTSGGHVANRFAIRYQGPNAENSRWLQFIWREVIGQKPDNSLVVLTDSITTTGGSYTLTGGGTMTTPGAPGVANYNTDSASTTTPFYEGAGVNNRTSDSTTLYDLPYSANDKVAQVFASGATHAISRAHFTTYLIQDDKPTFKVELNLQWVFNSAPPAAGTQSESPGTSGAVTALDPTIHQRFVAQWPAFNFIP